MTQRVLTALDHRVEDRIAALLAGERQVQLVRRCPDLADLLAAAAAGLGDLALVSGSVRGLDRDALAQLGEAGVRVVGVVDAEEEERRLRQLGIADLLLAAQAQAELPAILRRLTGPAPRVGGGGIPSSPADALAGAEVAADGGPVGP